MWTVKCELGEAPSSPSSAVLNSGDSRGKKGIDPLPRECRDHLGGHTDRPTRLTFSSPSSLGKRGGPSGIVTAPIHTSTYPSHRLGSTPAVAARTPRGRKGGRQAGSQPAAVPQVHALHCLCMITFATGRQVRGRAGPTAEGRAHRGGPPSLPPSSVRTVGMWTVDEVLLHSIDHDRSNRTNSDGSVRFNRLSVRPLPLR